MNICLYQYITKQKNNAIKARTDALSIAVSLGYKHIGLFHSGNPKPFIVAEIVYACIKTIIMADRQDKVFIQYPYYPNIVNRIIFSILHIGKKIKRYKTILLIHDLISYKIERPKTLQAEIIAWEWMDYIICHNERMLAKIQEVRTSANYAILGPFYYLYNGPICKRVYSKNPTVVIAGNLSKEIVGYVYRLSTMHDVYFDLYGTNYSEQKSNNLRYKGLISPEELPSHLEGQFGLVWYGDSLETCTGTIADYIRYISPHKISLYIAAGLPVIVWEESALASFVIDSGIGVCVRSLTELSACLSDLREDTYDRMVVNVMHVRKEIVSGKRLKDILNNL